MQQNRMVDFCQFNSWSWHCDFMCQHRFFCKWRHGLPCVFTVININEAVSNVNSMVSMVNDTPNVNTSDVDAINQ